MTTIWSHFRHHDYLGLAPWAWIQFESPDYQGPLTGVGGVAPETVACLRDAHAVVQGLIESVISNVFARRLSLGDPSLRTYLEDAYAEIVRLRPQFWDHIRCGRGADGSFDWGFPLDPRNCVPLTYTGLRVVNKVTGASVLLPFERSMAPAVGRFVGCLDGSRTVSELRHLVTSSDDSLAGALTSLLELLDTQKCCMLSESPQRHAPWFTEACDSAVVHLGHATLLYRQRDQFFLFDPWLIPWFAEAPVPSPWGSLVPRPTAIFVTHEHPDHLDRRTLVSMGKDIPVIIPSRRDRRTLHYDYSGLLRGLGFEQIVELPHGESWAFDGGAVVSVPFFGEDPCDIEMPRNCYLVTDRGRNTLMLADSGPSNCGNSLVKDGIIDDLVRRHGPIATVFASQQQIVDLRTYNGYACLSPPGRWLEIGEDSYVTNGYLAQLAASARARQFVAYSTGGADWYPDDRNFLFSRRNAARTPILTANWEPPAKLKEMLAPYGCRYHSGQAFDVFRPTADGGTEVRSAAEALDPARLFGRDQGNLSSMQQKSQLKAT